VLVVDCFSCLRTCRFFFLLLAEQVSVAAFQTTETSFSWPGKFHHQVHDVVRDLSRNLESRPVLAEQRGDMQRLPQLSATLFPQGN
jgi:hypothetical protein